MPVRLKVFFIITVIVLAITTVSIGIGVLLAQQLIIKTIENDMTLVASLADNLVTGEINLLKANASTAAQVLLNTPDNELHDVLREQVAAYNDFMAITIFNRAGKVEASFGEAPTPAALMNSEYGRRAFNGETVISTTRHDPSGALVFHVCVPMEGRFLSVTIPGLHFSNLVNEFKIWKTGHIVIDDNEGTIIANIRPEWVQERRNFIEMAKTDSRYEEAARTVRRMVKGETGIGRFSIDGDERVSAFMPLTGSAALWSLAVIAPLSESPYIYVRIILILAGMFFLGFGVIAAAAASDNISRPFYRIREQNIRLEELSVEAQAASKAKSKFLANMSHEMRTPLNAIIGLSELSLGREQLPETAEKNLEKIYSSGMTLLGIVNDLLDISKIESGRFEMITAEYDLPGLLNDTVTLNAVRIGGKPVQLNLLVDENLPCRLSGDELRIKQIFNNILSNAIKYTHEGTVDFRVSVEPAPSAAPPESGSSPREKTVWLTASVTDSGIGIKPEDMGKLFTDYNRLDTKKNRNLEGTGLGLALTKRITELMGGAITVESEYGKGSTFSVRLCQRAVDDDTIGAAAAENLRKSRYADQKRSHNAGMSRIQLPDARVLVVDDVEINLDVARGMMEPYGMAIDCVLSGQEAIDLIRGENPRYDAVFMDHMMPGLDGIETVRIMREEIGTAYAHNVPVIALTANAVSGTQELFLNKGFQDFLSKPMDILRLDEVIRRWIMRRRSPPLP